MPIRPPLANSTAEELLVTAEGINHGATKAGESGNGSAVVASEVEALPGSADECG